MSTPEHRRVPPDQIATVVKALYTEAERIDWEHLSLNRRTALYDEWVTDPSIGGVLTKYMSSENARSWIKDGPMKEYSRAMLGAGRYAQFGPSSNRLTPERVVAQAVGQNAEIVPGSAGVKPFHCRAVSSGDFTYVTWGPSRNLRHLVWACINHLADHITDNAVVVIIESFEHPTTQADKNRHLRISERCSISFKYMRLTFPFRTSDGASA